MKRKLIGLLCAALVISSLAVPASAFASTGKLSGNGKKPAGILTSIAAAVSSLFSKGASVPPPPPSLPPAVEDDERNGRGLLDWLLGGGRWHSDDGWWDCNKDESYKMWKRYYCY